MFDLHFFATWFLIFIFYSFSGWLIEVVLSLFEHRKFINRGFLIGPICPIYGTGAVLLSTLISADESYFVIFCVSMLSGATLEYLTSYIMERLFRVRWWDYSNRAFNLEGRICLSSSLLFGVAGILILKIITPALLFTIGQMSTILLYAITSGLGVLLITDFILSLWLILGVRVTVGTVARDATDEIAERVREILLSKSKLSRRLIKAFPEHKIIQKGKKRK